METKAIENFLSTIDLKYSEDIHYANALRDAKLYNWDKKTLLEIWKGINAVYHKKDKHE